MLQDESVIDDEYHRKCPFDEYLRVTSEERCQGTRAKLTLNIDAGERTSRLFRGRSATERRAAIVFCRSVRSLTAKVEAEEQEPRERRRSWRDALRQLAVR